MSSGKRAIFLTMASCTCSAPCPSGRWSSIVKRVVRSTSVPMADLLAAPVIRSPSQWPGTARSSTSAGRSLIMTMGSLNRGLRPSAADLGRRLARPDRSFASMSRLSWPLDCT